MIAQAHLDGLSTSSAQAMQGTWVIQRLSTTPHLSVSCFSKDFIKFNFKVKVQLPILFIPHRSLTCHKSNRLTYTYDFELDKQ